MKTHYSYVVLCLAVMIWIVSCGRNDISSTGSGTVNLSNSRNDTKAPSVPTSLKGMAISSNAILLSWSASTDDVGVSGYKIYRNGTQVDTSTTNSYNDTGLLPNTTYTYTVSAYDAAMNNSAQSLVVSEATLMAGTTLDTQSPTMPTNFSATATSTNQISLSWTESTDNVGVKGYKIYRVGTYLITSTTTTAVDTGLTDSTIYCYTVSSVDYANNESAKSESKCATTLSTPFDYLQVPLLSNGLRNKFKWPFAVNSIWNQPIGSHALYLPAAIVAATQKGMTVDEDIIIQRADAPLKMIVLNNAAWDPNKTRCGSLVTGSYIYPIAVPVPNDFKTDPGYLGITPNMSAAILLSDRQTILQTQPFHVCSTGIVTSQFIYPLINDNIGTGSGIEGAHGGSGMSSLGGTLRVGELVPGGVIRHALKINLYGKLNYNYDSSTIKPGYRWPAVRADSYAGNSLNVCAYGGKEPAMRLGSLVALKPDFGFNELLTEPAKILAQAFMDYGAYAVDDTCWNVYAIVTEWGPDGRVVEEFKTLWKFPIETAVTASCTDNSSFECKWAKDMNKIFTSLHVVDNNAETSIGGGGIKRQSPAPAIGN